MNRFIIAAAWVIFATAVRSQGPQEFEVATIKVHSAASTDQSGPAIAGNRLARSGNVNQLMMFAFDLKGYQLSGGPDWVAQPSTNGDYYDIVAIAEGPEA